MPVAMFCVFQKQSEDTKTDSAACRLLRPVINCPQSLFVTIRRLWSPITRNSIAVGQRVADITTGAGQGHDKLGVRAEERVGGEGRISIHIHLLFLSPSLALSLCVPNFVWSLQSVRLKHHNRHCLKPPPPENMGHLRLWKRHLSR